LFYESQSKELFDELEELDEAVKKQEELGALGSDRYADYSDGDDEDDDDDSISRSPAAARQGSRNRKSSSVGHHRTLGKSIG